MSGEPISVRSAADGDIARIVALASQLGYDVDETHVRDTLRQRSGDFAVFVAVAGDVVGWIGVRALQTVTRGRTGEVEGIVVDERRRSRGAGKLLLENAERWARERGCSSLRVHTNVVRDRAHAFYRRERYQLVKSQHLFEKGL